MNSILPRTTTPDAVIPPNVGQRCGEDEEQKAKEETTYSFSTAQTKGDKEKNYIDNFNFHSLFV